MARSQETWNKKEKEKQRQKKNEDKAKKKEARRDQSSSGKLEDMMVYVDEHGMLTDTPPDELKKKIEINPDDIEIGIPKREAGEEIDPVRQGKVAFFNNDKGYGFIRDLSSQESIFVHIKALTEPIAENDKVTFETEKGPKGLTAVRVKKV